MSRFVPLLSLALGACVPPLPPPQAAPEAPLEVGEARRAVLRALRLDVEGASEVLDLPTLQRLPLPVLERVWLLDVPLEGLIRNALDGLGDLTVQQARALPVPARNMRTLLRTTPDNAVLEGTSLEELVGLSAALGVPPGRALSELLDVGLTEPVIPRDLATEVLVEHLVGSHPASRWRDGPVDPAHPDGRWPVAPGSLPVTLADVVTGFDRLTERFGPASTEHGTHPGFLREADGVAVVDDDFQMVVRVDVNALPYRGLDLTTVTDAAVNSTGSQIEGLFPVDDPGWLRIEGLVDAPAIARLTVGIVEDDAFHPGGLTREPAPTGSSTAWDLPPWAFERLIAEMALRAGARTAAHCIERALGTGTLALRACVEDDGWTTFQTFQGLGSPPPPAYLWDLVLELAQVRLHDGGLPEGGADVSFTLHDVPLGIDAATIAAQARANVAAAPTVLRELAELLTENGRGAPDLFYRRGDDAGPEEDRGDWLFFLAPEDVPAGDDGAPIRPYAYARPGFFADEALTTPVGGLDEALGDAVHHKVRVEVGDVLFVQDDAEAVFRLEVVGKPSRARLEVEVTRTR